jgi:hypothetical protein
MVTSNADENVAFHYVASLMRRRGGEGRCILFWTIRLSVSMSVSPYAAVTLGFAPASYTVSETDGFANLIIVRQGTIDRALEFSFTTQDGTATGRCDLVVVG